MIGRLISKYECPERPTPVAFSLAGKWPSLAKAPALGAGDREFESLLPDSEPLEY